MGDVLEAALKRDLGDIHLGTADKRCRVIEAFTKQPFSRRLLKVRLEIARDEVFYYPDLMITCDSRDTNRYFMRHPKVLIEVLSGETERTDRREKFFSYPSVVSLK